MQQENKPPHILTAGILISTIVFGIYKFNCYKSIFSEQFVETSYFLIPSLFIIAIFYIISCKAAIIGGMAVAVILLAFSGINCTPYDGGGASMIEILILISSFISAFIGCILGYFIFRK